MVTTAWNRREALHQGWLTEAVGSGILFQLAQQGLAARGLFELQAAGAMSRQLVGQAYLLATTDLFRLSAWLSAALVEVMWFTHRPATVGAAHAAE